MLTRFATGQVHDDATQNSQFTCHSCGYEFCLKHETDWHTGLSCTQYDASNNPDARRRKEENEASETFVRNEAMRCPNPNCNAPIQVGLLNPRAE